MFCAAHAWWSSNICVYFGVKDFLECLVVNVTNYKLSSFFAKMMDCQLASTKKWKKEKRAKMIDLLCLVSVATRYESKKETRREWFTSIYLFSLSAMINRHNKTNTIHTLYVYMVFFLFFSFQFLLRLCLLLVPVLDRFVSLISTITVTLALPSQIFGHRSTVTIVYHCCSLWFISPQEEFMTDWD